ncbi:hypothetical protein LCGC14_1135130 [marine sediment metagenome]|uniref:Uncharacterized protein n=1 Tax=marine sediment metagenome TaxID=412755 RepID=A0A0F9Q5M3_9ZZZZ
MLDFTYYRDNKISLHISDCSWLAKIGLRETQWILDTKWILTQTNSPTFNEWIGE